MGSECLSGSSSTKTSDEAVPGPSGIKRSIVEVKNPQALTEEELPRFFELSDTSEDDASSEEEHDQYNINSDVGYLQSNVQELLAEPAEPTGPTDPGDS